MAEYLPDVPTTPILPNAPRHKPYILPGVPRDKPVQRGMKYTEKERAQLLKTARILDEQNKIRRAKGKEPLPYAPEEIEALREQEKIDKIEYNKTMLERIQTVEKINKRYAELGSSKRVALTPEEIEWKRRQTRIDSVLQHLPSRKTVTGRGMRKTRRRNKYKKRNNKTNKKTNKKQIKGGSRIRDRQRSC